MAESLPGRERIVSTMPGEGIAKADYEEAMGLYDLFLALMNEKASKNLLACRDFAAVKALARCAS